MPISGVVIRFAGSPREPSEHTVLRSIPHLELGSIAQVGVSAVIDAPDYASHDASLARLGELPFVAAVDIIFHDFSDVRRFERQPEKRRAAR